MATPPKIDGDLSDPVWKTAPKAEVFGDQFTGTIVPDQTIALVLYDEKNIYIAFDCHESQPSGITARETIRDSKYQVTNGPQNVEDNVEVQFDTFQSFKSADLSRFSVNAIGTPSASLAGGRANKAEWKGDFIAAVKRTPTGWTAEMQIPWASLNYPNARGPVTMGINFVRFQDRTKIQSIWSNTGPHGFQDKEGSWVGVVVPQSKFHPKLSLLPYVLGAVEPDGGSLRGGLDARYTLTPELTAVGSFKPDFSTVEGAIQGIQFSRTERFIPERRPFFLEGQNYFNVQTRFNDIGAFFYSNRIETFDIGTKLYGKISPRDTLGFFDAYNFQGRNDLVARVTHDINRTSRIGGFILEKNATDDHNDVAAMDYQGRWGKAALETINATTKGPGAGGGANVFSGSYQDKNLTSVIQYHDLSNSFRDADGFIPFTGYKGFVGIEDWSASYRHGPIRSVDYTWVPLYWWHTHGEPFYRGNEFSASMDTRTDWRISLDQSHFTFDDSTDSIFTVNVIQGATNRFRQIGLQLQSGIFADQHGTLIGPTASFRLFKKLDLTYAGTIFHLGGVTQQHILTANYELSPTRSFGGRMVNQDHDTNLYLFYHNSGGKGTEMFVVLGNPNSLRFEKKLEVKFVFAVG